MKPYANGQIHVPVSLFPSKGKRLYYPLSRRLGDPETVRWQLRDRNLGKSWESNPGCPVRTLSTEPSVSFHINQLNSYSDRCAAPRLQGIQHSSTVIGEFISEVCSNYCHNKGGADKSSARTTLR